MTSQRLDYIDVAKGIGILFVICSHSRCNELMWFAWASFMPVFFVLSGYTYQYKNTSWKHMIWKKAKRLLTPYVFTNIVLLTILAILGKVSWRHLFGIIYSRFYIFPNGKELLHWWCAPTWFLTALFITYLIVFLTKGKENIVISYIPIFLLLTYGLCQLPILLPWSIDTAFIFASYIIIGLLIRRYNIFRQGWKFFTLLLILYIIIILFDGNINYSIRILGYDPTLSFIAGSLGSILIIWISRWIDCTYLRKPLIAIGRNSLLIFCFHIPFISTFNTLVELTIEIVSKPIFLALSLSSVLLTVLLCYYLAFVLSKIFPFLK